jgi:Recombination directionality factor-like
VPILNVQISLREVGRIRCGDQVKSGRGKAPRKLDRFRFTSDDAELLGLIADRYGGDVEPWADAPNGEQLQVYVTAERIPVMVVPGLRPITQWWEAWSGGGCLRRCDGQRDVISGAPCPCDAEDERLCKPTTRLHVVLPEIPGLGTWRLETHGYYAAVELGGTMALVTKLVAATGEVVHGTLRLQQRSQKVQGQPTRRFAVPSLDVSLTIPELVERMSLQEGSTRVIDASNADRVKALAAVHQHPSSAFPTDSDREAAEQRGVRKLERKRTPDMGPGRRRQEAAEAADVIDEELVHQAFDSPLSDRQLKALQTLFRMTGLEDRDERLLFSEGIIGHKLRSSKDLTSAEAAQILDLLTLVEQGRAQYISDPDGRIVGAVPVDADLAEPLHDLPVPHPDELEDEY